MVESGVALQENVGGKSRTQMYVMYVGRLYP